MVLVAETCGEMLFRQLEKNLQSLFCRAIAVDEESERLESGKAGALSAFAASAAGLPFALSSSAEPIELASSIVIVFVTGLLFGVTYRYPPLFCSQTLLHCPSLQDLL